MDYSQLFELAKTKGITDVEVYYSKSKSTSITVFEQEVESLEVSANEVITLRGIYNGKMGYTYTENLNNIDFNFLLDRLVENAKAIENEDLEIIFEGSKEYQLNNQVCHDIDEIQNKDVIATLKMLERDIKESDSRIDKCYVGFGKSYSVIKIVNSKGLNLTNEGSYFSAYADLLALEEESRVSFTEYKIVDDFAKIDFAKIGKVASKKVIEKLHPTQVRSGSYPTILSNKAASALFSTMIGSFMADSVQKGVSSLKGKLNTQIAGINITLVDDPFCEESLNVTTFDDEGVATKYKEIIKDGVLKTFLYNLKTAAKDNVETTGNGFKGGVAGTVNISPTNAYLLPGNSTVEELVSSITDKGLYITSVMGTHSGTNEITGDFSLQADGFYIEDGKIVKPVNLITVSGNYFELINNIETIGGDLNFKFSSISVPSIKIKSLVISGN